jgi:hypothetical protein
MAYHASAADGRITRYVFGRAPNWPRSRLRSIRSAALVADSGSRSSLASERLGLAPRVCWRRSASRGQ